MLTTGQPMPEVWPRITNLKAIPFTLLFWLGSAFGAQAQISKLPVWNLEVAHAHIWSAHHSSALAHNVSSPDVSALGENLFYLPSLPVSDAAIQQEHARINEAISRTRHQLALTKACRDGTTQNGSIHTKPVKELENEIAHFELQKLVLKARSISTLFTSAWENHRHALVFAEEATRLVGTDADEGEVYETAVRHEMDALTKLDSAWHLAENAGMHLVKAGHIPEARTWFGEAARVRESMLRWAQDKPMIHASPSFLPDEAAMVELLHLYALARDSNGIHRVLENTKEIWTDSTAGIETALREKYFESLIQHSARWAEQGQIILSMDLATLARKLFSGFSQHARSLHDDELHQLELQVPKYVN